MADTYVAYNAAMPTTAAMVPVTTGTAIKTMLQLAIPATRSIKIVQWGISWESSTVGVPIRAELIETDVAATVTAHVAAGVQPWFDPSAPASLLTLGTTATGFTATAEGTTTASRVFAAPLLPPTQPYDFQFPLGRECGGKVSKFVRIRVTAPVAVPALCYVVWEE